MKQKNIPIKDIEVNKGQIDGLPKNPRFIKDDRFKKLVQSIEDAPEMLAYRTLLVIPHNGKYVAICGNMRLRACREIGYKEMPCTVLDEETPPEKLREYAIKDNIGYGSDDWDILANEWNTEELEDWGMELPTEWGYTESEADRAEIEAKKKEFAERMAAGELNEEDEEYQQFVDKFIPKKTTDDCYTPALVYDAVADWVANRYGVKKSAFVRPFYPGGNYKEYKYPKGCVVVDNPPFSIEAEILTFYKEQGVRFFLFAPSLTLFSSSSSSSICCGVNITYENGADIATSFLTNLEDKSIRFKSEPMLYKAVKEANERNLSEQKRSYPKYKYPDYIVTSSFVSLLSKYGIDYSVCVNQSCAISSLDSQKESGKTIYGKGYLISEAKAKEKAAAEKAAAEKAAAIRWQLSEREKAIVAKLSAND